MVPTKGTTVALRIRSLAAGFWAEARLPEVYPRDVEQAVALVLPVGIVKLPLLTATRVTEWLARNSIRISVEARPFDLMGCVVACRGHGLIFVCGGDPADEQRLTIAHETAHFLAHYLLPRQRVVRAMGNAITEVLDGEREATADERVAGILAGVRVGAHVHLLHRNGLADPRVGQAEDDADGLGLELVAPHDAVLAFLRTRHVEHLPSNEQQRALALRFGVPVRAFSCIVAGVTRNAPTGFVSETLAVIRRRL